jgi:hypothetical protein
MALAKGWRTCGLMSDTEYRIMIVAVSEGTYHVPVAERTPLEYFTDTKIFFRFKIIDCTIREKSFCVNQNAGKL